MKAYAIYNATYSELKGKPSVEFQIQQYSYLAGGYIPIKGSNIQKYNIIVTDEDDSELCRKEIREFVSTLEIVVSNIENEFPIL